MSVLVPVPMPVPSVSFRFVGLVQRTLVLVLCVLFGAGVDVVAAVTVKSAYNFYTVGNNLCNATLFHPVENVSCKNVDPSADLYVAAGVPMYVMTCRADVAVGLSYQGGNGTSIQNLGMTPVSAGTVLDVTLEDPSQNFSQLTHISSSCAQSTRYPYSWYPTTDGSSDYANVNFTCCIVTWTPAPTYPQQNNLYVQVAVSAQTGQPHAKLSTLDPSSTGSTGAGTGTGSSPPSSPSGTGTGTGTGVGTATGTGTGTGTGSPTGTSTGSSPPVNGTSPTGTGSTLSPTSPSSTSSNSNSSSTGSGPGPTSPPRPNRAAGNAPHSVGLALPAMLLVVLAACIHFHLTP